MSETAAYQVVIHRNAEKELADLRDGLAADLKAALKQLRYIEEPHSESFVQDLSEWENLFRVRVRDARAICTLEKPAIVVLAVAHREDIYSMIETAANRREAYV